MKYKINITTEDCELLDVIEIDTTEINWDSNHSTKELGRDIIYEIKNDIKRRHS